MRIIQLIHLDVVKKYQPIISSEMKFEIKNLRCLYLIKIFMWINGT